MTTERSKLLAVDEQGNLRYKALLTAGIVERCEAVFCYGSGTVPDPQDVDKLAPCPECHGSGYVLCDEAVLPGRFLDLGEKLNLVTLIQRAPDYHDKWAVVLGAAADGKQESTKAAILSVLEQAGEAGVLG